MKSAASNVIIALLISVFGTNALADPVTIKTVGESYRSKTPAEVPGNLNVPVSEKPVPAVLILHGSAGPDTRGPFHAAALNAAGIATLEIDMWKPRGVINISTRPPSSLDTLPDVWGSYLFLKNDPRIDPKRIGVMGFSWGGVSSMLVAFDNKPKNALHLLVGDKFSAAVAFYPICDSWTKGGRGALFTSFPTDAPVLIHVGTKDDYEISPTMCEQVKTDNPKLNLTVFNYEGDTHGFDMQSDQVLNFFDPTGKGGKGAHITMRANRKSGELARTRTVDFFKNSFGMN